jgi:hypothetical protein
MEYQRTFRAVYGWSAPLLACHSRDYERSDFLGLSILVWTALARVVMALATNANWLNSQTEAQGMTPTLEARAFLREWFSA